ncbi:VOC family protein [Pollutibacter soli]|uniref:VOC family protein n=1 Tax=Pollutibacter soli TaxID=3034157 RepID=UPI0030139243
MGKHFLQGIDTIIIRVSDIEQSKTWYTEKLGMSVMFEEENTRLVVLDTFGPTSLTIWETPEKISVNPNSSSYPIFKTPNAEGSRLELIKRDVKAGEINTDEFVSSFVFYDPDGNILELCQVH